VQSGNLISGARRLAAAGLCAAAAAAVAAPSALASGSGSLGFSRYADGGGAVSAALDDYMYGTIRLEVLRNGTIIASDSSSSGYASADVMLFSLLSGDVATVRENGVLIGSVTYDGLPSIAANACVGSSSFTGVQSNEATVSLASASSNSAVWTQLNPFKVTLQHPLAAGDWVYVATQQTIGALHVEETTDADVGACPAPPPPPSVPPVRPPLPPPAPPTDPQVLDALELAVDRTGGRLRTQNPATLAKKKTLNLPFRFSEAGLAKLRLTAPGARTHSKPVVIGSGAAQVLAAGERTVPVKLTAAGRKLLARARTVKLTLKATFAPQRGGKSQSSTATITLKRR